MREIEIKLIEIITLFEYLIFKENEWAYQQNLKSYKEVYVNLCKNPNTPKETDFDPLIFSRIFYDTCSSDKILKDYLSDKMDEFYDMQQEILKAM